MKQHFCFKSVTYRWNQISISGTGVSAEVVFTFVAEWLGDKNRAYTTLSESGMGYSFRYRLGMEDSDRVILYEEIMKQWPNARVAFYGDEVQVVLRDAVCLDKYIQ